MTIAEFYEQSEHPRQLATQSAFVVTRQKTGEYKVSHLYDGYGPEKLYVANTPLTEVESDFANHLYVPNQFGHGGHWSTVK